MRDARRYLATMPVIAAALLGGCVLPSHLHNAEDAAAAKKAQIEFAAYDESAPGMYQAMLTNLERFKTEQDRLLADLARNRDEALVTKVTTTLTFTEFERQEMDVQRTADGIEGRIKTGVEEYFQKRKVDVKAQADAKATIAALKEQIASAKANAERWSKAVGLLKKGLASVPATGDKAKLKKPVEVFTERLGEIAKTKVEYRKADGSIGSEEIGRILKDGFEGAGTENDTKRLSGLLSAPGIELTILSLGLDLAEVEKRAADVRLGQLTRRAELYEDSYTAVLLARELLKGARSGTWDGPLYRNVFTNAVEARRQHAAIAGSKDTAKSITEFSTTLHTITGRLTAVRRVVVADAILARTEQILALASTRLDHEDSILGSRAADESWRAVIRSGLAGLVAFHDGGFTGEDAANIIRIAQAVGLAFIAGGVQ